MNRSFKNYIVRDFDTTESAAFFKLVNDNRQRLEDFFPGTIAETKTPENTRNYCKRMQEWKDGKEYFPFVIIDLEDNSFVGYIDVKRIDWKIPKAEMGYFIDSRYEGKGIISKALSFVLQHLADQYNFKKILCRIGTRNEGSSKVVLKNGFELEGTIRADFKTSGGEIIDLNYYGKII